MMAAMIGTSLLLSGDSIECESCPAVPPISFLTRAFAVGASSFDGGLLGLKNEAMWVDNLQQRRKDFCRGGRLCSP